MKKISLITIFDNPNFGTYLQALALGIVLMRYGNKVEIVRYMRPIWHNPSLFQKRTKWLEPLREWMSFLLGRKVIMQRIGCRKFVENYIPLSNIYYSYEELLANPPLAEIYLTGSDQVWNTIHNHGLDKSFYLGFAPQDKPKYAYAASIGMNSIPDEYVEEIEKLLSQYKAISVREISNVYLLNSIGINTQMVLDPTLLLTSIEWKEYACRRKYDEKYVLVYSVESKERDEEVGRIARKIADEKGLKVYEVSYFGPEKSIPNCDKHFYYATPDIFLSLVSNASFMVGSSFHFTAFAINFNKDFLSVAPERFSSRIDSLLSMTKLSDRKVESFDSVNTTHLASCDFHIANEELDCQRKKSFEFIKEIK